MEQKFLKKLLIDQQTQKEAIQNAVRRIEAAGQGDREMLMKTLLPAAKSLQDAQKYCKVAAQYGISVASEFAAEGSSISLDDKEQKRLEACLKKRKEAENRFHTPKKRFAGQVDQSNDICKKCGEIGHWQSNPICPKYSKKSN